MGPQGCGCVSTVTGAPRGPPCATGEGDEHESGQQGRRSEPLRLCRLRPSLGGGGEQGQGGTHAGLTVQTGAGSWAHCPDWGRVLGGGSLSRPAQGPGLTIQTGAGPWAHCPDHCRVLGGGHCPDHCRVLVACFSPSDQLPSSPGTLTLIRSEHPSPGLLSWTEAPVRIVVTLTCPGPRRQRPGPPSAPLPTDQGSCPSLTCPVTSTTETIQPGHSRASSRG